MCSLKIRKNPFWLQGVQLDLKDALQTVRGGGMQMKLSIEGHKVTAGQIRSTFAVYPFQFMVKLLAYLSLTKRLRELFCRKNINYICQVRNSKCCSITTITRELMLLFYSLQLVHLIQSLRLISKG